MTKTSRNMMKPEMKYLSLYSISIFKITLKTCLLNIEVEKEKLNDGKCSYWKPNTMADYPQKKTSFKKWSLARRPNKR